MSSVPAWVPLVSAIAGGGLVGILNLATNWLNKRSEERRQFRQLILTVATENWKQMTAVLMEGSKRGGKSEEVMPVDAYIIHLTKLAEVLMDSKLTKENISQKMKEVYDVSNAAEEIIRGHSARASEAEPQRG